MASRMDRYSKTESNVVGRSDRNKSLYKKIEDLDSYTNIAGVAKIENKNSIDIEKVRELLKVVEKTEEEFPKSRQTKVKEIEEDSKNYDIKELLSKMKDREITEDDKYRSLTTKQQKLLKELNKKNKSSKEEPKEIQEKDIVPSEIEDDDVGLLDDLKSDTMVGDASSIKKIIDEEKEFTKELEDTKIDKSFYTSSFGFTQRDFEELKDINHKIKKDNKKIITLLIILIVLIVLGAVMFIIK